MLLNIMAFARPDTNGKTAKQQKTARLLSIMPVSDGIFVFESKRFLNEALPKVLAANQPILGEITAKLNEVEATTGIDLRKFEQIAVGVTYKQLSAKETDFEPLAIASGDINAGALIAVAKLASKGEYRTEKVGERTIYVFTAKELTQQAPTKMPPVNSKIAGTVDSALKGLSKDIAVTAYDGNTLVLGTLSRVRETLEGRTHVAADLVAMLSPKDTSIMSFAAKTPQGMSGLLPLDNDELGTNIDAIVSMSGSLDVSAAGTGLQFLAKTRKPEQAQSLRETLDGLKMVGSAIFGNAKRPDQQVYGRIIKAVRIDSKGTDVSLDLLVPQADIDQLVGGIKIK
jgi:hypothetical protein